MGNATLVIMAAGLGSRYGGNKQADRIGPDGELLMEYSAYDAIRAGFDKVVFVVRPEMEGELRALCGDRIARRAEVAYAHQTNDSLPEFYRIPAARSKPFGTVHALLCTEKYVKEPFAILNADDFYGAEAFQRMMQVLLLLQSGEGCMVSYRLKNTLSENGTVTRAIVEERDGWLYKVRETRGIQMRTDGSVCDEEGAALSPNALISMNFWGFTPELFPAARDGFERFLRGLSADETAAEYCLPTMVDELIRARRLSVRMIATDAAWFGVTYREDRQSVCDKLTALHADGTYPRRLFESLPEA